MHINFLLLIIAGLMAVGCGRYTSVSPENRRSEVNAVQHDPANSHDANPDHSQTTSATIEKQNGIGPSGGGDTTVVSPVPSPQPTPKVIIPVPSPQLTPTAVIPVPTSQPAPTVVNTVPSPRPTTAVIPDRVPLGYLNQLSTDSTLKARATVRMGLIWGLVEKESAPGTFTWKNAYLETLSKRTDIDVQPVILGRSDWSVARPGDPCSSAPKDLNRTEPLKEGQSYSELFYRFAFAFGEHYRGRFDTVVLENEMNAEEFWCDTPDAYVRVLLTLKKAFRDSASGFRVTDGGVQGYILGHLVTDSLIQSDKPTEAINYFRDHFGDVLTIGDLKTKSALNIAKPPAVAAASLLKLNLWSYVDVVNFHHYDDVLALPRMIAFIRERAPTKSILTNEIGTKVRGPVKLWPRATYDDGASELIKKIAVIHSQNVAPIIWFNTSETDTIAHLGPFFDGNAKPTPNLQAFSFLQRLLKKSAPAGEFSLPTDGLVSVKLRYPPDGYLVIFWTRLPTAAPVPKALPDGCRSFDKIGTELPTKVVSSQGGVNVLGVMIGYEPVLFACGTLSQFDK